MTIVDKPLAKSDLESVRGNCSGAVDSLTSGIMDGSCSSWGSNGGSSGIGGGTAASELARVSSVGPVMGPFLYSHVVAGVTASCSSAASASSCTTTSSCNPGPAATATSPAPLDTERPKEQVTATSADGITLPQKVLFPAEQLNLKWAQVHRIGAGLQNLGNTCFLNSALQCLAYTPPLANYMLSREHSKTCHEPGFCMMCTMQNHITQVFANAGNVIKPIGVLNDLKRIAKHFRFGSQEDAHEFLRYTVDAMQKSCLPGNKLDRHTQATTLVHQVFGGYLRSRVKCLNCKAVSDTFDPYLDVALDIKTAPTINKAFEQFVKPEQLDGENAYKCAKCKKMVPASKRFTIHRSPNALTISLKRFANYNGGKIAKDVRYAEYLDLRPYMSQSHGEPVVYKLYAVLVHSGFSCHAGHYYCFTKAPNSQWHQMNDSSVSVSDIRTVLNQQAYMLFYIRCNDVKNGGETSPVIRTPPRPVPNVRSPAVNRPAAPPNGPSRLLKFGPQVNGRPYQTGFKYNNSGGGSSSSTLTKTSSSLSSSTSTFSSSSSASHTTSRATEIADPDKRQKLSFLIGQGKSSRPNVIPSGGSTTNSGMSLNQPSSSIASSSSTHSTSNPSTSGSKLNGASFCSSGLSAVSGSASALLVPYGPESSEESDQESCSSVRQNGQSDSLFHAPAKPANGKHLNPNTSPTKRHSVSGEEMVDHLSKANGSTNGHNISHGGVRPSQNGHHKYNGIKVNGNGHAVSSKMECNGKDAECKASSSQAKSSKNGISAGLSEASCNNNGSISPTRSSPTLKPLGQGSAITTHTAAVGSQTATQTLASQPISTTPETPVLQRLEVHGVSLPPAKGSIQHTPEARAARLPSPSHPRASGDRLTVPLGKTEQVRVNGIVNGRPGTGDTGVERPERDRDRNVRLSSNSSMNDRERDHHRRHQDTSSWGRERYSHQSEQRDSRFARPRSRSGSRERHQHHHRDPDRHWDRHRPHRQWDRNRERDYQHHRRRRSGSRHGRDGERERERKTAAKDHERHHRSPGYRENGDSGRRHWAVGDSESRPRPHASGEAELRCRAMPPMSAPAPNTFVTATSTSDPIGRTSWKRSHDDEHSEERQVKKHKKSKKKKKTKDKYSRDSEDESPEQTCSSLAKHRKKKKKKKHRHDDERRQRSASRASVATKEEQSRGRKRRRHDFSPERKASCSPSRSSSPEAKRARHQHPHHHRSAYSPNAQPSTLNSHMGNGHSSLSSREATSIQRSSQQSIQMTHSARPYTPVFEGDTKERRASKTSNNANGYVA